MSGKPCAVHSFHCKPNEGTMDLKLIYNNRKEKKKSKTISWIKHCFYANTQCPGIPSKVSNYTRGSFFLTCVCFDGVLFWPVAVRQWRLPAFLVIKGITSPGTAACRFTKHTPATGKCQRKLSQAPLWMLAQ